MLNVLMPIAWYYPTGSSEPKDLPLGRLGAAWGCYRQAGMDRSVAAWLLMKKGPAALVGAGPEYPTGLNRGEPVPLSY